ncbi:hypothetical protein [Amycolatopsis alba]|nr:hypothetical protein [Amycolatopsis alba]
MVLAGLAGGGLLTVAGPGAQLRAETGIGGPNDTYVGSGLQNPRY